MGSAEAMKQAAAIIIEKYAAGEVKAVVVSALSGITNLLIELAQAASDGLSDYNKIVDIIEDRHLSTANGLGQNISAELKNELTSLTGELRDLTHGIFLLKECTDRSLDLIMSYGERLSALIFATYLQSLGHKVVLHDSRESIKTNQTFGNAKPLPDLSFSNLRQTLEKAAGIVVLPGFIASDLKNHTTTLGRGGSDFTAALVGAACRANEIHIYTDVDGMLTADPKIVPNALQISQISYEEAMELSHFGAKVIYPPTLKPAFEQKIPIRILNTFNPANAGTLICAEPAREKWPITGITAIKEIALFNIQGSGLVGVPGFAGRLFQSLAQRAVSVILITQASSEHSISFAVDRKDLETTRAALEDAFSSEFAQGFLDPIGIEDSASIVAIVGENMKDAPGTSGKIFHTLGRNGINVMASAQGSSELNISVVIHKNDLSKALNALHQTFFEPDLKTLHVCLAGTGLIGKTLLLQLRQQAKQLRQHLGLQIRLIGLARSRKMLVRATGIPFENWENDLLENGTSTEPEKLVAAVKNLNLPNSVFIDCTSGDAYIPFYMQLLEKSIGVVSPNKLANSASLSQYQQIARAARRGNTRFLYETNVGAGLPVIQTLKNLISSGDEILKIEAILSGTLSFIFNRFSPQIAFAQVVKEALDAGYTEPDPRDDLNGKDMGRKALILARECGWNLEPEDVDIQNILPQSCVEAQDVQAFFETLSQENEYFKQLAENAAAQGKKLKFICTLQAGKVQIQLLAVDAGHPFWNTSGADNVIAFYTRRYHTRPLVVQGPGAGAEVTAAGVFGDLIALAH